MIKGIYPRIRFENKDAIWNITLKLFKDTQNKEQVGFIDSTYSVSRQIFFYSCPNQYITNEYTTDINRYHYCKEMNTPPYEGPYNKQPAKWLEKYYIIRGVLSKLESIQIKRNNKGN